MGKKRSLDPGLQYLQMIKFERIRGKYGLHDRLIKLYGREEARKVLDKAKEFDRRTVEFYEYKNSNFDLSMAFNEAFDSDIIRRACNYVAANKQYFGNTILEVGCESGSMTGFLALTFPGSKIVSIDRSEAALSIARQRVEGLNIDNVEFRCCSLADVQEQFDTVFCMRTIQENLESEDFPFSGEPILYQFACYSALTKSYTKELIKRVSNGGKLCIFERVGHDPLMCGWMMTLNMENCGHLIETYKEVICEEADEKNVFQAFICQPGINNSLQDTCDLWYKALEIDPTKSNDLQSWNALVYLQQNAGELLRGVYIMDPNDNNAVVGRFGVFTDCDEKEMLYYFFAPSGSDIHLFSVGMVQKEEAFKRLQETIDLNVREGFVYKEIDPSTDIVEGNSKEI